ncbi:MAG: DUF255 domain-containing protein [Fimbriimonadaceae bacterium]|nr:DUF255 domain-containing protein [Fimbriimonadaceae bacterium]QYK57632.1 MAG: DUF255 domain-containing protein [Fimbriimonadaceae bacterium]
MPNRLANEPSLYLRQHQDNPVDWYPWGDEAWEKARREDKPVFLSVGYSSCHWCHVMAHESFEDTEVAAALNREFVSIKLDREERPDLDEVYMTAVQMANGHGGWPMTLFLTPDQKPFFAGTYFPLESRGEYPGFRSLVTSLAQAWRAQRDEVLAAAEQFATALASGLERRLPSTSAGLEVSMVDIALDALHEDYDHEQGGFGDRPKFPPHAGLLFLIDYARIRPLLGRDPGDRPQRAEAIVRETLEAMAHGGVFDHLGGGFHRYSTDERWHLPHFEKMLYDNGQLLESYGRWGDRGVAVATAAWIEREMTLSNGMLASAIDADSEGEEGAFYLWRVSDIEEVLGEDAPTVVEAFQASVEGNFLDEATHRRTGQNVLHLRRGAHVQPELLARLFSHRSRRPRPVTDPKAVAAWNGLALSGLVACGCHDQAARLATVWEPFVLKGLPHQVVDGVPLGEPFLDDLAFLANGFLDLGEAVGGDWSRLASKLLDQVMMRHSLGERGLAFSPDTVRAPFGRPVPYTDGATPSPVAISVRALRRLGRQEDARSVLWSGMGWLEQAPRACLFLLREVLAFLLSEDTDRPQGASAGPPVFTVRLEPTTLTPDEDGWAYGEVVVDCPPGWHINTDQPSAKWLTPTSLTVEGALGEAGFPDALEGVLEGEVRIPVRLRSAGSPEFEITVRFQPCSQSECLSPEERKVTGRFAAPSSKI